MNSETRPMTRLGPDSNNNAHLRRHVSHYDQYSTVSATQKREWKVYEHLGNKSGKRCTTAVQARKANACLYPSPCPIKSSPIPTPSPPPNVPFPGQPRPGQQGSRLDSLNTGLLYDCAHKRATSIFGPFFR